MRASLKVLINLKTAIILHVALLSCVFCVPVTLALEINLTRSKLIQLALHLEVADKQLQYDFSRIAILEMINTYEQELLRSQKSLLELPYSKIKHKTRKSAKIRSWQIATRSYLNSIDHYLFSMDSGVSIEFLISKQNKIIILIGKQPLIISGPNSGSDKQIEHNIVEQFCLSYDCREYFQKAPINIHGLTESVQDSGLYAEITGEWHIHSDLKADFISSNGLVFKFNNIKQRALKEKWSVRISNELLLIQKQLKIAEEKGNQINWSELKIVDLPLTDNAHKIVFNKNRYIKSASPLLGKNHALFIILKPWIENNFKHHLDKKSDFSMIINNAELYFFNNL